MPWKAPDKPEQHYELVRRMREAAETVGELCRRFRISRQTAYRWRRRLREGRLAGLKDRSHRPARVPARTGRLWLERLRRLRLRRPTWGARKLRHNLGKKFGRAGLPAVASLNRCSSGNRTTTNAPPPPSPPGLRHGQLFKIVPP